MAVNSTRGAAGRCPSAGPTSNRISPPVGSISRRMLRSSVDFPQPASPTSPNVCSQVLNLIQELQKSRNLTYLFISHDLSMVKHISDRVGVMSCPQISFAYLHLPLNRHPAGGLIGLGTSPSRCTLGFPSSSSGSASGITGKNTGKGIQVQYCVLQ